MNAASRYPAADGTPGHPAPTEAPTVLAGPPAGPGEPATAPVPARGPRLVVAGAVLVGLNVAVVLGAYGRIHTPTGVAVNVAGFSGPGTAKAWLATIAVTLAVVQLLTALAMYGVIRVPPAMPGATRLGALHRWSGRGAFLVSVPVALHCLYALGFAADDGRVLAHSVLGCLFYGAFTTKMLGLTRRDLPGWFLPVLGGVVLTVLALVWTTSALWLFAVSGIRS